MLIAILGIWIGGFVIIDGLTEAESLMTIIGLIAVSLLFVFPEAALATKRLRDLDEEPAFAILYILLPLVPCVGGPAKLIMWLYLAVAEGTPGPNMYGPPSV